MKFLPHLFENNRKWVAGRVAADPDQFERLKNMQNPGHLWIGCADSRVPANEIVGLPPGDLFVHRNVANLATNDDPSVQCVLEYGVNVLDVDHIIVCGHYGCGGIDAALGPTQPWAVERWIEPIRGLAATRHTALDGLADVDKRRRLAEFNVAAQVENLCTSNVLRDAWLRGTRLTVHGWMYDVGTGLLSDLGLSADGPR